MRPAAIRACPATCPPKTRWRSSSGLNAAEDVHLNGFEVEQVDEELERGAHAPHVRRPTRTIGFGRRAPIPLPCAAMTSERTETGEERLTFPEGFTWGVATAAHQIEGGNVNNDWWDWEHIPGRDGGAEW